MVISKFDGTWSFLNLLYLGLSLGAFDLCQFGGTKSFLIFFWNMVISKSVEHSLFSILWNMLIFTFFLIWWNMVISKFVVFRIELRSWGVWSLSICWNMVISQFHGTWSFSIWWNRIIFQFCGTWSFLHVSWYFGTWSFLNLMEHGHFSIWWNMVISQFGWTQKFFNSVEHGHGKDCHGIMHNFNLVLAKGKRNRKYCGIMHNSNLVLAT